MSKKILFKCGLRRPAIYVPCLVLTMSLLSGMAWGFDLPGLGVTIQPEAGHEDLKYAKGDPIKLDIITRNTAGIELYTERGFSKLEQHRFLSLIDPGGKKYFLGGEVSSGDAPPPFFIEDRASARLRELVPAELLAAEYNKPVAVTDLTELFPVMKTTLGWYTLEVNMPFIRFYYTREDNVLGLLGDAADTENWDGTLNSNRLQLQITLPAGVKGAYLKIHVRDQNQQPLGQVPVRVFETAAIAGLSLEDAFATATPVLSGSTDPDGLAVWNPDTCQPEDDYTAIAYYNEEYKMVAFAPGETGWADECAGEIEKQIVFGAAEGGRFSVLALEHVWLRTDAVVSSGDVAANKSSAGQILCAEPDCEEIEVYVDAGAFAADNVQILGDTIFIASGASVFDVAFNDLENHGEIRGQQITPLTLPVWTPPAFLESTPGGCNVTVSSGQTMNLDPGAYANVIVSYGATLNLTGGTYHFNYIELKDHASLICLAPAEIRIKTRFECDDETTVEPAAGSGYSAKDVVIYVGGVDAASDEQAVEIDRGSIVRANIYSPNGTLYTEEDCQIEGSFIGKEVEIGIRTTVALDNAFGEPLHSCDFENDGDVDGKDLAAFALAYYQGAMSADVNNDGTVNPADVGEFAGCFGQSFSGAAPPLPSSDERLSKPRGIARSYSRSNRPGFVSKKLSEKHATEDRPQKHKKSENKNRRERKR